MSNYATLQQLKLAMNISDAVDDSRLTTALGAASRWVDGWCDRTFGTAGTAVEYRDFVPADTFGIVHIDDCVEVTEVRIDDDLDQTYAKTLRAIDWAAEPVNSTTYGIALPFTRLRSYEDGYWPVWRGQPTVRVYARYGWPAVPEPVREATILQAARLFVRNDSPLGVAGFGDMGAMRVSRFVDPDVEMLLQPYKRIRYT